MASRKNQTANDVIYTPQSLAKWLINYFKPTGTVLDPAAGKNAFYKQFKNVKKYRCEITEGIDFFDWNQKVDWIITNPPYSTYKQFLTHCFKVANNVVLLIPVAKIFAGNTVCEAAQKYGGIKQLVYIGTGRSIGFPFGFTVCAIHYKKNYKGSCKITYKT